MDYIELNCKIQPLEQGREVAISFLGDIGFESFVEHEEGVFAYIPVARFSLKEVEQLFDGIKEFYNFTFIFKEIKDQNWNAVWENNFQPVLVLEKCLIRAPFHQTVQGVDYDIIIEPKMSFGTAHHETTQLMIEFILETTMLDKKVLDMGCGTGVLAILAYKCGAAEVTAIDNDNWAYENSLENFSRNNIPAQNVKLGDAGILGNNPEFDIIIANINRNILSNDLATYVKKLNLGGVLFLSGFYIDDIAVLMQIAEKLNLKLKSKKNKNNWAALELVCSS